MGAAVVTGAVLKCTFGTTPSTLNVTSQMKVLADNKPMATIQDMAPVSNIPPFGMCISMANPAVAAATAAAAGVLTPQPCTMAPMGPWPPKKPTVMVSNKPCLTSDCTLQCMMGQGTVMIVSPGQMKVML